MHLAEAMYVSSANGASSLKAWGIAPGLGTEFLQGAEGATHGTAMNRAFSAGGLILHDYPGRCPRLFINGAPLALNRYI
jgi:hypothetical protein